MFLAISNASVYLSSSNRPVVALARVHVHHNSGRSINSSSDSEQDDLQMISWWEKTGRDLTLACKAKPCNTASYRPQPDRSH